MTRDEARAMAALMLAYADGKTVQFKAGSRHATRVAVHYREVCDE